MIHNAYKLMEKLKRLVDTDDDQIWIDYKTKTFHKVHDATTTDVSFPFPKNEPSVQGLLKNLRDEGYIIIEEDGEYCSLTYKSLYYEQIKRSNLIRYFFRSIFVPVLLAFITTVITNLALPLLSGLILQYIKLQG